MIFGKEAFEARFLSKKLWRLSQRAFGSRSSWSEEQFFEDLLLETSCYFLEFKQKELIGFLQLQIVLDSADVLNLAVAPDYQRTGSAFSLMKEALEELKERKVKELFLEVRDSNLPAIHLYQKIGFDLLDLRKNYYDHPRENALLMKLEIN